MRVALLPALLVLVSCSTSPDGGDPRLPVAVVAHRGARDTAPENTLTAFARAIELGCSYLEVDVRKTSDGQLVLMHDRTVDRTTNGEGNVAELSFADIRALEVRSPWLPAASPEQVPTFGEALALCKGRIEVLVDCKEAEPAAVVATLREHGMIESVVIYDSLASLHEFRELSPELRLQAPHPDSVETLEKLRVGLRPHSVDGNLTHWSAELAAAAHDAGMEVWIDLLGLLDTDENVARAVELGADVLQTDRPAAVLRLVEGIHSKQQASDGNDARQSRRRHGRSR